MFPKPDYSIIGIQKDQKDHLDILSDLVTEIFVDTPKLTKFCTRARKPINNTTYIDKGQPDSPPLLRSVKIKKPFKAQFYLCIRKLNKVLS